MDPQLSKLSELTFQHIVESVPNAIVLVNKEGKIVYINSQTEKLFGYNRPELIGKSVEILIPARYREKHPMYRDLFFDTPSVRAMGAGRELFALRKDGTEFPIEIGLNPLVLVEGTLVLASIIDITARKAAEHQFKLVVNSAPNAMVLVNQTGNIALVNKEAVKLFGYDEFELIGKRLETLIPERFHHKHEDYRSGFFEKPQKRPMGSGRDLFGKTKEGKEIPIEIGLNPIETNDGMMVLASVIDITQRKVQEESAKRQAELEVKNKELEQFAYIASHDLQEPLRTVSNYALALEEDYGQALDEQALRYLTSIRKASGRMSGLVSTLLNYSRLGRDRKLVYCDLEKIVNETLADMTSTIQKRKATIHVSNLPSLYVYETEMRQMFLNLIGNAIKFCKVNPEVHVHAERYNDQWKFSVRDNGIGIDRQYFAKIFQVFQRLHKVSEYDGYGIGLPYCKKIAELHGGEIWVESSPGKGSTFLFTISNLLP